MSFLDYTGEYTARGDKFIFKMKGGKRKTSKFFTIISDPTYDNAFKTMLCFQKSILKSLLNSVLFPESKLIEKLEYSKKIRIFKNLFSWETRYQLQIWGRF